MHVKHLLAVGPLLFTVLEAAPFAANMASVRRSPAHEADMKLYENDRDKRGEDAVMLYDHDKQKRGEDAVMLYDHDKQKRGEDAVMLYDHDKQKRGEDEVMVLYEHDHRSFNADFADK